MSLVPTQHYIHEDSDSDWDEGVEIGVAEHHLSMERIIMKLERGLNTALNACLRGPHNNPSFMKWTASKECANTDLQS